MIKNDRIVEEENPCPCNSGITFPDCCGATITDNYKIVGDLETKSDQFMPQTEAIAHAIQEICNTPDLFPAYMSFHTGQVEYVKMSERWFNESIFLDPKRIMGSYALSATTDHLAYVSNTIQAKQSSLIFHTAFCGSTLISKALAELFHTLPVREPQILDELQNLFFNDDIDAAEKSKWLQRVSAILSRTFHSDDVAIIKTNDYANALLPVFLKTFTKTPVLFLYVPLSEFLAACLKDETRHAWILSRYRSCRAHLAAILGINDNELELKTSQLGKMAALYWAYNILLFDNAFECFPEQLRSLNFNRFIKTPISTLERCASFFKLTERQAVDKHTEMDWLLSVHSKNTMYDYNPEKRQRDIENILAENKDILKSAEGFARELLAQRYPVFSLRGSL